MAKLKDFVLDLARRLEEFQHSIDISQLFSDEYAALFTTVVQQALLTIEQEKRNALRNALVNSLRPDAPMWDRQEYLVHLVDQLTRDHIRILGQLYYGPRCSRLKNFPALRLEVILHRPFSLRP